MAQNLLDITQNFPQYSQAIHALGIIVDADADQPSDVAKNYADKLRRSFPSISGNPGIITSGSPRTGIYVWPDSQQVGTLETLLLECAALVYPDHKKGAQHFLNGLDKEHRKHWRGSEPENALVASIVSVLQPGKANHASFATLDDKWISGETLANASGMKKLWIFIHNLLELAP